ncbi:MAG: hypothetical protein SFU99_00630, partial [Saprospiraceae bacterium]|nr:hypothetical protein [Saprospiraceae bacterium]
MIQDILLSPKGNPLIFDIEKDCFKDQNTDEIFEIINGVPILLPSSAEKRCMEVTLSNGVKAKFYYVDHYHQDAELFDYFESIPDGASQHENKRLHEMILSNIP